MNSGGARKGLESSCETLSTKIRERNQSRCWILCDFLHMLTYLYFEIPLVKNLGWSVTAFEGRENDSDTLNLLDQVKLFKVGLKTKYIIIKDTLEITEKKITTIIKHTSFMELFILHRSVLD